MQFDKQITMLTDKPPKGWPAKLFVTEYAELDDERKTYYGPVYAKYRTKKYRSYGEYGEFEGWEPRQIGVGKPIGYRYVGRIVARIIDDVMASNVLATRILARNHSKSNADNAAAAAGKLFAKATIHKGNNATSRQSRFN